MIISLLADARPERVQAELTRLGLWVRRFEAASSGSPPEFFVSAHSAQVSPERVRAIPGVQEVRVSKPAFPRLEAMGERVEIARRWIGADAAPVVMAGPCSLDTEERIDRMAAHLSRQGVAFLRGGAYKPRTSPYAFQGHGEMALRWMRKAADRHGMAVVTEAMGQDEQGVVAEFADLVQIGSRNMQNYALLKSVSGFGRPILLKRGMAATLEEWMGAAEYCLLHGAPSVVFCERGIRSFEPNFRNLLDLSAVALLAHVHRLPVIADPSHAAGRRDLVLPLARAALAAGAHGVMIETHPEPGEARSDGPQALLPEDLAPFLDEVIK